MSIRIDQAGNVQTIIIDRPDASNAVDPKTALALYHAFVDFEQNADARVAVLTGANDTFCAGFDLKYLAGQTAENLAAWQSKLHFESANGLAPFGPMGPTRLCLSKPVIAAVSGAAVAGGMELAMWCDFRVMDDTAYMGVYCRRWGVPLIDGGTVRLPRLVGEGRAMDLILTGRQVLAEECERIGLCEYVVPAGQARKKAEALAKQISQLPQVCLRADRDSVLYQASHDEHSAMMNEFQEGVGAIAAEGVKGAARFSGGAGRHGAPESKQ